LLGAAVLIVVRAGIGAPDTEGIGDAPVGGIGLTLDLDLSGSPVAGVVRRAGQGTQADPPSAPGRGDEAPGLGDSG
jgi:hypothetical protein